MTNTEKPKKDWTKSIGVIITVVVLGSSIIVSWATNNAAVNELQRNQGKLEQRIEKVETKVHDIELKVVADGSLLQSMKEDVSEIKQDVKTLLGSQ